MNNVESKYKSRGGGVFSSVHAILIFILSFVFVINPLVANAATLNDSGHENSRVTQAKAVNDGCSYGNGGPYAGSLCWLDMSSFDSSQALDGQKMKINLPGNIQLSYTVKLSYPEATSSPTHRSIAAVSSPSYQYSVFGGTSNYFTGVSGRPVLYQDQYDPKNPTWGGTISLENIVLTKNGNPIRSGWGLVSIDGESSNKGEGFVWSSDKQVQKLQTIQPSGSWTLPCTGSDTGWGSDVASCVSGDSSGYSQVGAVLTSTEAPSRFACMFINPHDSGTVTTRQGVAFALMFSNVQVAKAVQGRYNPTDNFTVGIDQSGTSVTSAETGTTGKETQSDKAPIVVGADGSKVTFKETATNASGSASSSILAHYDKVWSCTVTDDRGTNNLPLVGATNGNEVTLTVQSNQFVRCKVVNSVRFGSISWGKKTSKGESLSGTKWDLRGTSDDNQIVERAIGDNDQNDENKADGQFKVTGLPWGTYQLSEVSAPVGYDHVSPQKVIISSENSDSTIALGDFTDPTARLVVRKSSDPKSGSFVSRGQTVTYTVTGENAGDVKLSGVTIADDLKDVLDNASYVDGSAVAKVGGRVVGVPVVDVKARTLKWVGDLAKGETVTITYQVKVNADATSADRLVNVVTGEATPPSGGRTDSNCTAAGAGSNPDCTTSHTPENPPVQIHPANSSTSSLAKTGTDIILIGFIVIGVLLVGVALRLVIARSTK